MAVRINQYTPSITTGDGVSGSLFFIRSILLEMGFDTAIYADHIDENLADKVYHIDSYKESKENYLIYHHSIADEKHDLIMSFKDKKILLYHNITPSFYFKESFMQTICDIGREQLISSKKNFIASIADSDYNRFELLSYGYKNVQTIPLLKDFAKQDKPSQNIINSLKDSYNILFVGRIVPNKSQHLLADVLYELKKLTDLELKLVLVGSVSDKDYYTFLKHHIKTLSLEKDVIIAKKVSQNDLSAYYETSDIFLSLSEHEGFCIPLVEAMNRDVFAFGYNTTALSTTLPKSSLFDFKSPDKVAKFLYTFIKDPIKREMQIKEQRKHIKRFSPSVLKTKFQKFLNSLNIPLATPKNIFKDKQDLKTCCKIEGPFDSSYSLAIVNLHLSKALSHRFDTKLYSTEGFGDFEPSMDFLTEDEEALKLYKKECTIPDITIRNLYPPRSNALKGLKRAIGPYGWEESSFFQNYMQLFNARLTSLFAMSTYVKDTMINNGLSIPCDVTGIGADHILKYKPKKFQHKKLKRYKLLHISSCFPRKGVDILIEAFKLLKNKGYDDISLIIKTFPNPHSNVKTLIAKLPSYIKDDILLIEEEMSFAHINYLYTLADILVAPSRGEGFGLPMAEAMLFELPVVTTAFGGQGDFCTEETCWLVDYSFKRAKTHFDLFDSYWAEPSVKSLKNRIVELCHLPKKEIEKRTKKAKQTILAKYTWQKVSQNIEKALSKKVPSSKPVSLAVVSTFNSKCGIAEYTDSLLKHLSVQNIEIYANKTDEIIDLYKERKIVRCWGDRFDKDNDELISHLQKSDSTHLLLEFNFAFFSMQNLSNIIENNLNKKIFLELHSTKDVHIKGLEASLSSIKSSLQKVQKIIVHTINDLNILKNFGIVKNVALLPLGLELFEENPSKRAKLVARYKIPDGKIISSFGFLLPHKGTVELIESFYEIRKNIKDAHLLLLNSLYPLDISKEYLQLCKERISSLGLSKSVTFINKYLKKDELLELLSLSELIVLPYQNTQESSSASLRYALSTHKPVLCTPVDIFSDAADIIHFADDTDIDSISSSILKLLKDSDLLFSTKKRQEKWIKEHSFENISKRLLSMMKYNI